MQLSLDRYGAFNFSILFLLSFFFSIFVEKWGSLLRAFVQVNLEYHFG